MVLVCDSGLVNNFVELVGSEVDLNHNTISIVGIEPSRSQVTLQYVICTLHIHMPTHTFVSILSCL